MRKRAIKEWAPIQSALHSKDRAHWGWGGGGNGAWGVLGGNGVRNPGNNDSASGWEKWSRALGAAVSKREGVSWGRPGED